MDLEKALEQFDAVEANLRRLEYVWGEMRQLIPASLVFLGNSPENLRFRELQRSFNSILQGIPPIGAYRVDGVEGDLDGIAQARLNAQGIEEFEAKLRVESEIDKPTREIAEYRLRFREARRGLVRKQLQDLVAVINYVVYNLALNVPSNHEKVTHEHWPALVNAFAEVERLAGSQIPRVGRWSDLYRHLRFAEGCDVHDIANFDWPSVRSDIEAGLYSELEPVPVSVENLATLVRAEPTGAVTTELNWEAINAEDFERLLFNLIADAEEYVNPQWLMQTNAADRGRDLSAEQVIRGELSGTQHRRVMIQAKHWKKSIRPIDVFETLAGISAWEPPVVQVLVIATSGWFTSDAVKFIEKHNDEGKRPRIEMWPRSQLELFLARRPHLVSEFDLRS